MIQIPKDELLESLKIGYIEYRDCVASGSDAEDLAHIKGYCVTIEQILSAYGGVSKEEMMEIKEPIIGNVSLRRAKKKTNSTNYDVPTIFRKQFD
jgi:hypothetical protein